MHSHGRETVRIACQIISDTGTESDDEDKLADAGKTHAAPRGDV
jgi:hypothetical protein